MAIIARTDVLRKLAIDQGIEPTPPGLSVALGISLRTAERVIAGAPLSARTFETLWRYFRPGCLTDLFEMSEPGDAHP